MFPYDVSLRYISLTHGTDVDRCKCKYHFCYLCGKRWKTCRCPNADENYLSGRVPPPAPPAPLPTPTSAPTTTLAPLSSISTASRVIGVRTPALLTSGSSRRTATSVTRPAQTPKVAHEHDWEPVIGPLCQFCGDRDVQFVMHCIGCKTHSCWQCIVTRF